jgi:hypothetical protein
MKTRIITFFDIKGTVYYEFIPQGRRANKANYIVILMQLREAVCRKIPELWPNHWILHHDNVSADKALSVKQFLAQKSITKMEHPSYCPEFA